MKLLAFFIVYSFIVLSISGYRVSWKVAFAVSVLYIFLLRQGGFQGDFQVYLEELKSGWFAFYYLREPFFWVGSKVLYSLIGNERLVIFAYDLMFCLLLLRATKRVSSVDVFFVFLVSFPVFLGIENIYRQVLGLPLALFFLHHCLSGRIFLALFYLILASLFHNSYIVLSPLMVFCIPGLTSGVKALIVIFCFVFGYGLLGYFGLSVGALEKSSAQTTGLRLEYLYAAVILFISITLAIFSRMILDRWMAWAFTINIIYFFSIFSLGSSQAERVGMILIVALFYSYMFFLGRKSSSFISVSRIEMFIFLAMPVFIFPSTREFLLVGG